MNYAYTSESQIFEHQPRFLKTVWMQEVAVIADTKL